MGNIKESLRARIYDILDMDYELNGSLLERNSYCTQDKNVHINLFNKLIICLIFLNAVAFALGTFESIANKYGFFLTAFEVFSVIVFTIEYVLRLWTCGLHPKYAGLRGHLKYMVSFFAIIDLLSFLPFYLQLSAIGLSMIPDGRFFRTIRLIRVIKIFKYSSSMMILKNVIIARKDDLILTFVIGLFLMFISASFMYYFEHDAPGQEQFGNIFESMYWGIVPLTAVGYGDVFPVTAGGKLFSMVITIVCITMMALPTGIISEGFMEERKRMKEERMNCECSTHESNTGTAGTYSPDAKPKPENFACDGVSREEGVISVKCPHCSNYITLSINKEEK